MGAALRELPEGAPAPLTAYVFFIVPEHLEQAPTRSGLKSRARRSLRRLYDLWHWGHGRWKFRYWTYENSPFSNKGDIAVRLAIRQQLFRIFGGAELRIVEVGDKECTAERIDEINRKADIFIIGGSGFFTADVNGNLGPHLLRTLPLLARLQCPVAIFGAGVNILLPLDGRVDEWQPTAETRRLMTGFVARADLVSVRDEFSRQVLAKSCGVDATVIPDPVVYLEADAADSPLNHGVRVGLNVALHCDRAVSLFRKLLPVLLEVATKIEARTGCEFVYFVHYSSERLAVDLLRRSGLRITVVDADPGAMLKQYRTLDLHISMMMHSAILSLNAGVPTINMAYDIKSIELFKLLELEEFCIPATEADVESLMGLVDACLSGREKIAERIGEGKRKLRPSYTDVLERLRATMADSSPGTANQLAASMPGEEGEREAFCSR